MRGAGKDATSLFDSVHAWVNYEQLLSKCLVGPLRNTVTIDFASNRNKSSKFSRSNSNKNQSLAGPDVEDSKESSDTSSVNTTPNNADRKLEIVPRFDWIQKTADIVLTFYTRALCNPGLIVECLNEPKMYHIKVFIEDVTHLFKVTFFADVRWPCTLRLSSETGTFMFCFLFLSLMCKSKHIWHVCLNN